MATKQTDTLAQVMAAPTPAAAARALNVAGKGLRDVLRRHGVYVSHDPSAWDDTARAFVYAWFTSPTERKQHAETFKTAREG